MRSRSEAFFAEFAPQTPQPRRFCIWHAPEDPPLALVVQVHAFAEEMNKARRMSALQSRALANAGMAVLQFDLLGCGDSDGDFGDGSWSRWLDDIAAACALTLQCHAERWPGAPRPALWLWGLRAGCLLAAQAVVRLDPAWRLVFWQPLPAGSTALQQFLRLKLAADLAQGDGGGVMRQMRDELAAGRGVDVAGYHLTPALAEGLELASLTPPSAARQLLWLEVSSREEPQLNAASTSVLERWRAAGWAVQAQAVAGPAFWSTVEVEDAPALLHATTRGILLASAS